MEDEDIILKDDAKKRMIIGLLIFGIICIGYGVYQVGYINGATTMKESYENYISKVCICSTYQTTNMPSINFNFTEIEYKIKK